ncbi:predicted protein [Uncinocarpus reesii 1704]|uniref:Uncharacterized protein n=1 Tax=Uncinocarpus reesii (strain UAMH 1704) TaxID=336963 RepID=C4JS10_UNCRE|nr:uncharacterized protein UREG_05249 [Uncinocarpus reesii 1704]EEP80407.1 predicted protein [Uncinocarpus reesii 1704]
MACINVFDGVWQLDACDRNSSCYHFDEDLDGATQKSDEQRPLKRRRLERTPPVDANPGMTLDGDTLVEFDCGSSRSSATLVGCSDDEADSQPGGGLDLCSRLNTEGSSDSEDRETHATGRSRSTSAEILQNTPNTSPLTETPNRPRVPPEEQGNDLDNWMKGWGPKSDGKRRAATEYGVEKAKRCAAAVELPSGHWADAERDLFFRLAMRGFEPLVPNSWRLDFPTFPEPLFSARDTKESFIMSLNGHEFRAIKALKELLSIGPRVRDRQLSRLRFEPVLKRILGAYVHWALWDCNLHNHSRIMPYYIIYALGQNESVDSGVKQIINELMALAKQHQSTWSRTRRIDPESDKVRDHYDKDHAFPVLTGFLICGSIVAIITLDSNPRILSVMDPQTSAKFIAKFDFSEPGQDVWNSLAVAIAVLRMRKTMLQLDLEHRVDAVLETCCEEVDEDA